MHRLRQPRPYCSPRGAVPVVPCGSGPPVVPVPSGSGCVLSCWVCPLEKRRLCLELHGIGNIVDMNMLCSV